MPSSTPIAGRAWSGAAVLASLVFVLHVASLLDTLGYNYDEGVYIYQARAVQQGQHPGLDFFHHQPPPYIYSLALFGMLADDSVFGYRLLSVLATAAAGLLVFVTARRFLPASGAFVAQVLFYTAPLQFYGLIALPGALMVLSSTAAVLSVALGRSAWTAAAGAALLVVSILVKPLAIALAIPIGVFLIQRDQRLRLAAALGAGLVTGLASWLILDAVSAGGFSDVLRLQLARFSGRSGFDLMSMKGPFREFLHQMRIATPLGLEVSSPLGWNVMEHVRALLYDFRNGLSPSVFLVGLAALGQGMIWRSAQVAGTPFRILLTLWWATPFAFSLFIWEPVWDHYFVQYIPAFAILAALPIQWLWQRIRFRALARAVAMALLVLCATSGLNYLNLRQLDHARLPRPVEEGEAWLTFDPFLNLVTGTEPACGLYDPFNVYGSQSFTGYMGTESQKRFNISREKLIACLQADETIKIGIGTWGAFFVDERLSAYIKSLGEERIVSLP